MNQDYDDISKYEKHDTDKKLPMGWLVMSIILMAFCVFYFFAYTPVFTGWSQADQYHEAVKDIKK